ncbi:carboxymuconolactone decarboxylase family protein [Sphingopyxis sp. XHP0097]|jgi:uncharacterized peroxidase-related enzyme|uniref:Carboxymuconolactone decarboxylase family protein n=1 Tax=Sphingopyxis jiangsuensis TaxID=2871171 RepID=A0ABS7MF59_9SPHN|nr:MULTISPECIES: carboxymuconolactone decarboxylase family protein [Sphingopyxis]MBL0769236.1 carboxymuconolactone decarboxylase family protein [Sphingopyxis lutea]MBY4637658.1 carboxymuconolactone decarboxylase family protein [Sphingopyxis jiangsuensis]
MQRIPAVPLDTSNADAAALFAAIKGQLGSVPNIFRTMAQSPATLEAYLGFGAALGKGRLSAADRELVALAAAGANSCDYCASAHSALGKMAGLDESDIGEALAGTLSDGRGGALVAFTRQVVAQRGRIDAEAIADIRAAGFDDGAIVEILGSIVANIFTNYFNHIAETEIDFPVVTTDSLAAVA